MINTIKNLSLYLVISIVINFANKWLQSDFLMDFLSENLITLLIALLAINTTTISVIMTKLRDLTEDQNNKFSFPKTTKSMKNSIIEQVLLIMLATIFLIVRESKLISTWQPASIMVFDIILTTVFVYSIQILYDTANGVFVILKFEDETKKKNKSNSSE